MVTKVRRAPLTRLSRIAIDDATLAALAGASRLHHVAMQDLAGGACKLALMGGRSQRDAWIMIALELRRARRSSTT